uniref:YraN family protein n=1 Tax=uncultured Acinetobacter sp. TaxID=165433 RepID=UPI00261410A9|nr:YraN family protein [uncultured Acinetobacter sp.]
MNAKTVQKLIGQWAEDYALEYLQTQNLQLIQRNFHSRYGEIDLIMQDGNCLCFIEVRARAETSWTSAEESVDLRKQEKTIQTAQCFLQKYAEFEHLDCRFDVFALRYHQFVIEKIRRQANIQNDHADDKKLLQSDVQLARLDKESKQIIMAKKAVIDTAIEHEMNVENVQVNWIQQAYLS